MWIYAVHRCFISAGKIDVHSWAAATSEVTETCCQMGLFCRPSVMELTDRLTKMKIGWRRQWPDHTDQVKLWQSDPLKPPVREASILPSATLQPNLQTSDLPVLEIHHLHICCRTFTCWHEKYSWCVAMVTLSVSCTVQITETSFCAGHLCAQAYSSDVLCKMNHFKKITLYVSFATLIYHHIYQYWVNIIHISLMLPL